MANQKEVFWKDLPDSSGVDYSIRARLALCLLERWGTIAGKAGDHANLYEEKPVAEVNKRCWDLADAFFDTAQERGAIRYLGDEETEERAAGYGSVSSRLMDIRKARLDAKRRERKADKQHQGEVT